MSILRLEANQPADRFYKGGEKIRAFRDHGELVEVEEASLRQPEDWIGSITNLFDEEELGLTTLTGGRTLKETIESDPEYWLGPKHVERFGASTELLVKLLDAGQRLPVHSHPDADFVKQHLGGTHGKTEAWIALQDAPVAVAFNRDVSEEELSDWVENQDIDSFLAAMHKVDLKAGDLFFVPAGLVHAIGAGNFIVELQEPSDYSILMDWTGFELDGQKDGHLNLGFDLAMKSVDRRAWSAEQIESLRLSTADTLGSLASDAGDFFRADRIRGAGFLPTGFRILIVVAGEGRLIEVDGTETEVKAGETLLVPYSSGELRIEGAAEIIVCRPPSEE